MAAPLELEHAQARLLALAEPLPVEHVDCGGALGRYLAEPLLARRTQPAADLSAMDGYALRSEDLAGPWRVVGTSAAGHPFGGALGADEAVRIATGALLPAGAGSVLIQEECRRDGDRLVLTGEAPRPGRHIRRAGMDFHTDDLLLAAGIRFGPAQLALALTAGHSHVPVRRMPRIAVIDTGDELTVDLEDCAAHRVPASNGAMLEALFGTLPCAVRRIGPVADSLDALASAFGAAADADVIVTSGGASVGDHDLLQPALAALGARIDFWKVAIKPGKPLLVARHGGQLIVGLPGNPVSSHVTAYLFVVPLLRALLGAASPLPLPLTARLAAGVPAGGVRREFLRGRWMNDGVGPLDGQDSGQLSAMAAATVLIDRPANAPALAVGADVPVYLLDNGGIA